MSVRGVIKVDLSFTDRTSDVGVESLRTVELESFREYTTGVVIAVAGTCDTGGVTIDPTQTGYLNASGETVAMSSVEMVAFQASRATRLLGPVLPFLASNGDVSVNDREGSISSFIARTTSGTSSFTVVLYGT